MIDTIKIYTEIDKKTYDIIKSMSIVKSSFDNNTKQIQYEIINDHLKGSYDSSLSVRVSTGTKYRWCTCIKQGKECTYRTYGTEPYWWFPL